MKQAYVKSRVRVTDSGLIRMKIRTDVCKKTLNYDDVYEV